MRSQSQQRIRTGGSVLSTRRIVTAGVLAAIAVFLGLTRFGYIPVPNISGNATIMAIPVIIGAVLEGPVVGAIIGLIFGLSSFLDASVIYFKNPLVSVLPRIFIGIVPYLVYKGLGRVRVPLWFNLIFTGIVGSATNTVLVLFMMGVCFHMAAGALMTIAFTNGSAEAALAAVITPAVTLAYLGVTRPNRKSRVS